MPNLRLTQIAVERLKPPASGRVEFWDSGLPGFGLRVSAPRPGHHEGRKTWVAMYRVGGRLVWETLGTLATIPKVDEARDRARASLEKAQRGIHPAKERRQAEEAERLRAEAESARRRDTIGVILDRYVDKRGKKRWRPDTLKEVRRCFGADVAPVLGAQPAADVTRAISANCSTPSLPAGGRRLAPGRAGLTEINRIRLRPFDDRENIGLLLNLPAELMRQARLHRDPRRGAVRAQLAVAIEILLMAPIRMRNLATLDIERNLVRPGRGRALHIVISGEEVKNREPLEYPLPPEGVDLIKRYIEEFRPRLTSAGNTALFPGVGAGSKNQASFGTQISRTIRAKTGLRVHPHLFRHLTAKLFLDSNPGGYEVVRRTLSHRSIDTTCDFYTGLETAAAVRHFDETILNLRRQSSMAGNIRPKETNRNIRGPRT